MAKPTSLPNRTIVLPQALINEIIEHARAESPAECCGLVGGADEGRAQAVYRLRNIASDPLVGYEAAPEDLFAAQREIRARGQELLAIYHSHPRANDPSPSETDVRLAYYPAAIYLIIGLGSTTPVMRAFRISEREQHWQEVEYEIVGE